MVKDIKPGLSSSYPSYLQDVNGILFFFVDDGSFGRARLWKSDGTEAGTVIVSTKEYAWLYNPLRNSAFFDPSGISVMVMNGIFYFTAATDTGAINQGYELWRSDGTEDGTYIVREIWPGSYTGSDPNDFVAWNNTLYFTALDYDHGRELWKSDGTEAGTVLVKDIRSGNGGVTSDDSRRTVFTECNGSLYFPIDDGIHGVELWKTDGTPTGTILVKDIWERNDIQNEGIRPRDLTSYNGFLFFSADDMIHGSELWKSDGTEAGTVLVKDIRVGSELSWPSGFEENNGILYFNADDGPHGWSLWQTDGTDSGTMLVTDPNPGSESLYSISNSQNKVITLFGNCESKLKKNEKIVTRATKISSPYQEEVLDPGIKDLTSAYGTLFYSAYNVISGIELWESDGTDVGTVMYDLDPGSGGSFPADFTVGSNSILFTAQDSKHGRQLWIYENVSPTAKFITGSGWLVPAGATPSGAGKLEFDFTAKNVKNQSTPMGNVTVKVGGSQFVSTALDWLIVSGNRAKIMGSGTVNGKGDYAFLITAVDNEKGGNGTLDGFRIRIWHKTTNTVIYDNKPSESDRSYVVEEIGNGSIQLHQPGNSNVIPPPGEGNSGGGKKK